MPEPREELATALTGALSPEQIRYLVDEVLAVTKRARVQRACVKCGCKHIEYAEVPDALAVSTALPKLLDQAFGKRGQSEEELGDRIVFQRLVEFPKEGGTDVPSS